MITLENRFFPLRSAACFLIEGAIILLAVVVSFFILREAGALTTIELGDGLVRGVVVAFFCQSCMYMLDLYDLKHSHSWGELFLSLVFSVGVVCVGIGLITYAVPEFGVEGNLYYLTIIFVASFLLIWRIAFDYYLARISPGEQILVVGTGDVARMIGQELKSRERLGFHLLGFVGPRPGDDRETDLPERVLGSYSDIARIVREYSVRKLVVAVNERRGGYPIREMLNIRVNGCAVTEWPGFFEKLAGRVPIDNLSPSYIIFSDGFRKRKIVLLARRVLSATVAAAALFLVLPIMAIVAVVIRIDSRGPALYSQERVGQGGRAFRIYKFRSMREDAEKEGVPRWALKGDPRITRVGRVIRILRVDELPQLFNVLRGDIDLVGPRPERPEFVSELEKMIPYYTLRHTVKPGLTGWAQVMFTYSGSIEESREKLQYDLFYIKNMSLKLDLLILFKTLKIVTLGRGAR